NDLTWSHGHQITVKFIDHHPLFEAKVKKYAPEWGNYGHIRFRFVDTGQADIRIRFQFGKGSWTLIGTQSKQFSVDLKTGASVYHTEGTSMNFGWFTEETDEYEFKRTILHEFGHALGLFHEHLNPNANIKWNKAKVYAYYMQTRGWTREQVDINILNKYS